MSKQFSTYEKLVFAAYGYFILIALCWLTANIVIGGFFNPWASATVLLFVAQAYFRKRLTNLILGILIFGVSIFWLLEFTFLGKTTGFDIFVNTMLILSVISIIMSGILIFSYTKLGFKDQ